MPRTATKKRPYVRQPREAAEKPAEAVIVAPATLVAGDFTPPAPVAPAAAAPAISGEKYPQLTSAQVVALDRDGDGKPGGSLPHAEPAPEVVAVEPPADAPNPPIAAAPEPGAVLTKGAPPPKTVPTRPTDMCRVRITKAGHGQVFTGRTDPPTYDWNDEVVLPRSVGRALEGKQFGEILD